MNLPAIPKKESTDVCFLGNQNLKEYLSEHTKFSAGDIVTTDNKKIGTHDGLPFYTIGQRQGINIGGTGPYYVVAKNPTTNQLIVTNKKNDPALFTKKIILKNIHWISENMPKLPLKCFAHHRYQSSLSPVTITKKENNFEITFKTPERAIAPGQSLVLYKPLHKLFNRNHQILGGGIIENNQ